jgi:hypothetical protein
MASPYEYELQIDMRENYSMGYDIEASQLDDILLKFISSYLKEKCETQYTEVLYNSLFPNSSYITIKSYYRNKSAVIHNLGVISWKLDINYTNEKFFIYFEFYNLKSKITKFVDYNFNFNDIYYITTTKLFNRKKIVINSLNILFALKLKEEEIIKNIDEIMSLINEY